MRAVVLLTLLLTACDSAESGTDAGEAIAHGHDASTTGTPHSAPVPKVAADSGAPDPQGPFVDPLQCHVLCGSADAADCANAPEHQACVDLCERAIDRCPALVVALLDCFGPVPAFVCDADGNLASTACASELSAVQACAAETDAG